MKNEFETTYTIFLKKNLKINFKNTNTKHFFKI